MVDDVHVVYDFSRLSERRFEDLCRALAVHVVSRGVQAFGDGPDGGREASFDGPVHYSTSAAGPWNGYGVLQAKFRRVGVGNNDVDWLRGRLVAELDAWSDTTKRRVTAGRLPEYIIIATNVRLSSAPGSGGIDRIRQLMAEYSGKLKIKDFALWDANQLSMYLDAYPDVSRRFAEYLTPGDVLARTIVTLDTIAAAATSATSVRSSADEPDRFPIGVGHPQTERAFLAAYREAGGRAALGAGTSVVYESGPGWVQHLAGGGAMGPAVICAQYEKSALIVADEVWEAIVTAAPGQTTTVGLPAATESPQRPIRADVDEVALEGGRWGPGRLVRTAGGGWRWQPQVKFTLGARERDLWTDRGERMDARLRCATRIEWATTDFAIGGAGHRRVLAALHGGALEHIVASLAGRFGLSAAAAVWQRAPDAEGRNDRTSLAYRLLIAGTGGRTALGVWVRFQLPAGMMSCIVCTVDLRLDYACLPVYEGQGNGAVAQADRLDSTDLEHFFAAGWATATAVLPLAATPDPYDVPPSGPSIVELHLESECPAGQGGDRVLGLLDVFDLSTYGEPPEQPQSRLAVAITAPLEADEGQISDLVPRALQYMTSAFGWLDLDDE